MKPSRRTFWKAVGIAIRRHRLAQRVTLKDLERKSGLWPRVITSVETGEHAPTDETLRCLDRVLGFDEPLRSVLLSQERPGLWIPADLVAGADPMSLIFRTVFYTDLMRLGQRATLLRYCTPVLATALSPSSFLREAIAAKFGTTRHARELASQAARRAATDCERLQRGAAKAEALCLLHETRDHLRSPEGADRVDFIDHLLHTGNLEVRLITTRPTADELRALSFAMMTQGDAHGCVCITDQPLRGQADRDCWIDDNRSARYGRCMDLYHSFWTDRHTHKIAPGDLRGI